MPQLALPLIGAAAAVGFAEATAVGALTLSAALSAASVGWAVGTLASNVLFPTVDRSHTEGARLGNLTFQSSSYGIPRPIVYGKVRIAGNIIWALPIRETAVHTGGGGKGKGFGSKGGPSATNYTYSATFALALCEGEVSRVLRIWADNKLVYDATGGSDDINKIGFGFRFYPGTDTQNPDPAIEAALGTGHTPAYRGTCYLVFDDIPLADYGNRVPNFQVEVTHNGTPAYPYTPLVRAGGTIFGGVASSAVGINPLTMTGYVAGTTPNGIIEFDLNTMDTRRETADADILLDGHNGGAAGVPGVSTTNLLVAASGALVWSINSTSVSLTTSSSTATGSVLPFASTAGVVVGYTAAGTHIAGGATVSSFVEDVSVTLSAPITGTVASGAAISFTTGPRLLRVDPHTMKQTAQFSTPATAGNTTTAFGTPRYICNLAYIDPVAGLVNYVVVGGFFANIGVLLEADLTYVWGDSETVSGLRIKAVTTGKVAAGLGEAWAVSADSAVDPTVIYLDRITVAGGAIFFENMRGFSPTDIDPAAVAFQYGVDPSALIYDQSDDSLLLKVTTLSAPLTISRTMLVKWSVDGDILFAVDAPALAWGGGVPSNSFIATGNYTIMAGAAILQIDAQTGATDLSDTWPVSNVLSASFVQVYDSFHQIMLAYVSPTSLSDPLHGTNFWAKMLVNRSAAVPVTLQEIFEDVSLRAGYDSGDTDATALTDSIAGFVVSQRTNAADVLRPLALVYQVDAVERDAKIVFQHRGGATVADIIEGELVQVNDASAEPYEELRAQDIDLPVRATLSYVDVDRDDQVGTQVAQRVRLPDPTMYSDNSSDLSLALSMTATQAKQRADTLLYSAWIGRHTFSARLPPKYVWIEPADPVNLTLNSGYTLRARLGQVDTGVDYTSDIKLIAESDGQYVSTVEATTGVSHSAPISNPSVTNLILLDTPLLQDTDEMGIAQMRGYYAAAGYARTRWPGAIIQTSADAHAWTTVDTDSAAVGHGYLKTAPDDPASPWRTQDTGSLVVTMVAGGDDLASVTDLQLANGHNMLAIVDQSSGEVEILQFRDVEALGGDDYGLSVLLRGRRGTDTMMSGHTAGDLVVVLGTTTVFPLVLAETLRNTLQYYRAITIGLFAPLSITEPFTFHGRDKMPYAPVAVTATFSGSDVVLAWVRRTRVNGRLMSDTGTVPLNEATEAYEVEIYDMPGGSVLRTVTGLTSPTHTYTAAQITTDFGGAQTELTLRVYQISAVVARGFSREDTVEIAA